MNVIGHQHVGVDDPVETNGGLAEQIEESPAVAIGAKDGASLVSAGGDVVECAGEVETEWSCHGAEDPSGTTNHRGLSPRAKKTRQTRVKTSSERNVPAESLYDL